MPFSYNPLLGVGLDKSIPLDGAGKIPSTFLPSYVDDVEEYNNLAAFPATGETGKIYVAIDTGFVYRWSGSVYVQIGITAAAGSTTQVQFNDGGAFGGDAGLTYNKSTDALTSGSLSVTSAGAAATPSLTFTGDPNTGIFSPGADQLAISTGGTARLTSSTTALTSALPVDVPLGAAATPSLTFTGDLNTGIYSPGADQLAVATNGVKRIEIQSDGDIDIDGGGVFYDATNNRLAIGTTSPVSLLSLGLAENAANSVSIGGTTTAGREQSFISFIKETADFTRKGAISFTTYSANLASERARIDSGGRLLVGTSTADTVTHTSSAGTFDVTPTLEIASSGATTAFIYSARASIDDSGPQLAFARASATGGLIPGGVDTVLGAIQFFGGDGVDLRSCGGRISCEVDGTPGADDMPGRLVFSTTADGSASPTERLRITSAGVLQIADAGNITVGTTTGTKIGTATTQKIGFYNATPVVQPAAVADATDAATVITQLNDLLAKLRTLGIIAT